MAKVKPDPVIAAMDSQIEALEEELQSVQPQVDKLNKLKRARALLLGERGVSSSSRSTLDAARVKKLIEDAEEYPLTSELAAALGVSESTVRSHLTRNPDTYTKRSDGTWELVEE